LKATWDSCPSKAYLKIAVYHAGIDFIRNRAKNEPELLVDFQRFEAEEEDEDAVKDLYYERTDDPLDEDEYRDGDPLDVVDFMAMGFGVFDPPRPLSMFEQEVRDAWVGQGYKDLPEETLPPIENTMNPFAAFSERDRDLLEDRYYSQLSLRELAAKYGLSKSTLQRRLKDLLKVIPSKEDVVSKPSRQKKKRAKRKVSGTRNVIVATTPAPISA
jgi:hypothetical protein